MEVRVIRSRRKSISLEIRPDLSVVLRVPLYMPKWEIERFLREKDDWIYEHREAMRRKQKERKLLAAEHSISQQELEEMVDLAKKILPQRVAYFSGIIGVDYGRITIRNQKTRWGSCSSKGNLNFNCLLMKTPSEVQDYVVVHELCHRLEMNHSPRFWAQVERVLPNYKAARRWLKQNGGALIQGMINSEI